MATSCACGTSRLPIHRAAQQPFRSPTYASPSSDDTRARLSISLGLRHTRASLKSLTLGQTVFPEIGEATQFACHATFGLGYLAYCGALETRAHSLLIVRSSSRWGALGLWAGISNAHPNDYTLLGFTSFSQTYRAAPRPCPSAGACHEIKYNV